MTPARCRSRAGSFDAVLCVEAGFHFRSRLAFLQEARRILRPGGTLVMQDVLHSSPTRGADGHPVQAEPIAGCDDYAAIVAEAGFDAVEVQDVTADSGRAFYANFDAFLTESAMHDRFDEQRIRLLRVGARVFARRLSCCVVVVARVSH